MERILYPPPKTSIGSRTAPGTLYRKATDGPCRLCESKGVKVVWSQTHCMHPEFSRQTMVKKRQLNALV
jgi:hypothetical protein